MVLSPFYFPHRSTRTEPPCRRPSNASARVTGPVCGRLASTSTMGRRRRAAAIASPSAVRAFSRTRSPSSSPWKVFRSATAGTARAPAAPDAGPPGFADSCLMTVPLLALGVRGFGEPFDRGQAPVPLRSELRHSPGGLVEAPGFYLVENFPALLAPADQPGPLQHDQVFGDRLAGERYPPGQPAGADVTVADQQVKDPAAGRVGDGRPQHIIGLRRHPSWRFASKSARRSRYSAQPPWCSPA